MSSSKEGFKPLRLGLWLQILMLKKNLERGISRFFGIAFSVKLITP
jgi:hypothetical protein